MIFTSCTKCDEPIAYPYEAGQEPFGNYFDRLTCEKCGAFNFIQRVSFGGETLSAEEAIRRGLTKASPTTKDSTTTL